MHIIKQIIIKIILFFFITSLISCSVKKDYSGIYELKRGNCKSQAITLKKVSGFGNKYYLVYILDDSSAPKEYLGVIKNNRINVNSGIILLEENSIRVEINNKKCFYIKNIDKLN